jgi:glycosyltransferase involved in cell wall biosynthesis
MSLLICVTTLNRAQMLEKQLKSLRELTTTEFTLVVCDDGSSDASREVARSYGAEVIGGHNMGIAFNKNRGLFYAANVSAAKYILLLDDDTIAVEPGWEREWIRAIELHGHVNYSPPIADHLVIWGDFSVDRPGLSTVVSGQCLGFHRKVLARLGYMDTRYGRYGHEHVDFTYRAIKIGYGGFRSGPVCYFLVIKCGLEVLDAPSASTPEDVERTKRLFEVYRDESIYRLPWHSEEVYDTMMRDFSNILHLEPPLRSRVARFDADAYLLRNPDVAAAKYHPVAHWLDYGQREGRSGGAN